MINLKAVIHLARNAHSEQTDKLGRDYVTHHLAPIAEKLSPHGELAVMGGWLHDIVEDTDKTLDDLRAEGVPEPVVSAVDSVTRRAGEPYEQMIERAAADPLGRLVKLADNELNRESNAELAKSDPETAKRLLKKYDKARDRLQAKSHLFVIHGKIESLTHDVVIVPTDEWVTVESRWDDVTKTAGDKPRELPTGWCRWGSSSVWLIDVASGDLTDVLDRLKSVLEDITQCQPWRSNPERLGCPAGTPEGRRTLPLAAMPVLGIGRGGRSDERGDVLGQLVGTLTGSLEDLPFDIALVTPDSAVYAAAQHARRQIPPSRDLGTAVTARVKDLAALARKGEIALFLGAGVSIPAGLPTWRELVNKLSEGLPVEERLALDDLDITDKAQLIEQLQPDGFHERVAAITRAATRPSLVQSLLAGLDVANVVTTNYDTLFETAMRAAGHEADVVLPHQSAIGQRRWVLKMHGDVDHADRIVLTRRHMVMYDAANRPSAALLQSLLLTKHLVVIGASMTDPNVVRLTHEVDAYRREHKQSPLTAYGTVLDAGPSSPSQKMLWEDQLDWVDLTAVGIGSGPRALEILVDLIGMYASQDSSWLLDERFSGLLDEGQRKFAQRVRELASDPAVAHETWAPLREALNLLGVRNLRPEPVTPQS